MKNVYTRTVVFSSVKGSMYALVLFISGLFIGSKISPIVYSIAFCSFYAILTFIFGEFIFTGARIKPFVLASLLILGYVIDSVISIVLISWGYDRNLFLEQSINAHLIFGAIYIVSMCGAYVFKKRMTALNGGLTEGLVS